MSTTPDNHAHWEQLGAFHGTGDDAFYDLDAVVAGGTLMGEQERDALDRATYGHGLSGLAGLRVAHLQSHLAPDSITMARAGATVTAIDFSATSLERAAGLAARCGVALQTVEANSKDLPHHLDGTFDLVYATIGVISWIDDLDAWMAGVERILAPGGTLVLVDLHPMLAMVGSLDPLVLDFPYGGSGQLVYSGTGTYANRDAEIAWTVESFPHSIGEIVMAAMGAGLTLDYLAEHCEPATYSGSVATLDEDGRFRVRLGLGSEEPGSTVPGQPIPLLFTLLATKPGVLPLGTA